MVFNCSARGLLKENSKVLFIEYSIDKVNYFALPGGKLKTGESLKECVEREFKEETNVSVLAKQLILVNEFIDPKPKHVHESWKNGIHQVESIFLVERVEHPFDKKFQQKIDFGMQGYTWLDRNEVLKVQYFPNMPVDWFFEEKTKIDLYRFDRGN